MYSVLVFYLFKKIIAYFTFVNLKNSQDIPWQEHPISPWKTLLPFATIKSGLCLLETLTNKKV